MSAPCVWFATDPTTPPPMASAAVVIPLPGVSTIVTDQIGGEAPVQDMQEPETLTDDTDAPGGTDPVAPAALAALIADVAVNAGGYLSLTVTSATATVYVHVPHASGFRAWCSALTLGTPTIGDDSLAGLCAQAEGMWHGWRACLYLYGPDAGEIM